MGFLSALVNFLVKALFVAAVFVLMNEAGMFKAIVSTFTSTDNTPASLAVKMMAPFVIFMFLETVILALRGRSAPAFQRPGKGPSKDD